MALPLGKNIRSLGKITVTVKAITGAADNGGGLIRITATAHGFATGDVVVISGVGGTTEANGRWTITVITADTFDLVGSAFVNTYTTGGIASKPTDLLVNYTDLRNWGSPGSLINPPRANSVFVQALKTNTGNVFIGTKGVNRVTGAGVIQELDAGETLSSSIATAVNGVSPAEFELDALNDGDGVYASYLGF